MNERTTEQVAKRALRWPDKVSIQGYEIDIWPCVISVTLRLPRSSDDLSSFQLPTDASSKVLIEAVHKEFAVNAAEGPIPAHPELFWFDIELDHGQTLSSIAVRIGELAGEHLRYSNAD